MDFAQILGIVAIAFLSSFGHCLGMCGGFVLAYNLRLKDKTLINSTLLTLVYHLFRILAYSVLGAIFGAFGSVFIISLSLKGYIFFALGVFLVLLGIALIFRGNLLKLIENELIFKQILKIFKNNFFKNSNFISFAVLGFINGLLPCGVVYYFLAMAISSASASLGALIMLIFGISTLPALLIFSGSVRVLSQKFKSLMMFFSSILIIFYGIYLAFLGFMAV